MLIFKLQLVNYLLARSPPSDKSESLTRLDSLEKGGYEICKKNDCFCPYFNRYIQLQVAISSNKENLVALKSKIICVFSNWILGGKCGGGLAW